MGGFHFDQLRRNELGVKPTFGLVSADPKTVLMPLPEWGFDPTEAAVSWKTLTQLGHRVVFATPNGIPSDGPCAFLISSRDSLWSIVWWRFFVSQSLRLLPLIGRFFSVFLNLDFTSLMTLCSSRQMFGQ